VGVEKIPSLAPNPNSSSSGVARFLSFSWMQKDSLSRVVGYVRLLYSSQFFLLAARKSPFFPLGTWASGRLSFHLYLPNPLLFDP